MVNRSVIFIRAMNSSLWIAVLVVHVGCIIEAQPSKSPVSSSSSSTSSLLLPVDEKRSHYSSFELIPAASQAASYNSRQSFGTSNFVKRPYRGRKFITTTTTGSSGSKASSKTTTTELPNDNDDDSCSGKSDGYYQNFGSGCSSYYFCAAGYQITYVCPPGEKYTGKKCDEDYKCPRKTGHNVNVCADSPNGYYSNVKHPGRYYYCFQQAKVIDLQCDPGKVFIGDECTLEKGIGQSQSSKIEVDKDEDDESCMKKSNGFYADKKSECKKYYYCINGDKTELSCQSGFIFNGDICVHKSRFNCPSKTMDDGNNDMSKKSTTRRSNSELEQSTTLPSLTSTSTEGVHTTEGIGITG